MYTSTNEKPSSKKLVILALTGVAICISGAFVAFATNQTGVNMPSQEDIYEEDLLNGVII